MCADPRPHCSIDMLDLKEQRQCVTHFPRASSTSPRLGSRPRTLPLHVSGISSSAGYAWSLKKLIINLIN